MNDLTEHGFIGTFSAEEVETVLIGHLLSSRSLFNKALAVLNDDMFVWPIAKTIWKICRQYEDINSVPSAIYLSIELKKHGFKTTSATINKFKILAQSSGSFEHQYETLSEQYRKREFWKVVGESSDKARGIESDSRAICAKAIQDLEKVSMLGATISPQEHEIHTTINEVFAAASGESKTAIATGLTTLDKYLNGGWERGTLNVVGARSGQGKTAFAMWVAATLQKRGTKCGFVSMEMTRAQMNRRELSIETDIHYQRLKSGKITEAEKKLLIDAAYKIEKNSFTREYTGALDLFRLRGVLSKMKFESECELIVIDYLQMMKIDGGNKANALGEIVNELKAIAVRLDICIVLICQINRESVKTDNKEPKIYHLKDSGSIEEAADTVILLHRPEVYDSEARDENGVSFKNRIGYHIEKNRDGDAQIVVYGYCNMGTNQFYNSDPGINMYHGFTSDDKPF
jgi:replicative DNA helicase